MRDETKEKAALRTSERQNLFMCQFTQQFEPKPALGF